MDDMFDNELTKAEEERLIILAEECSEVVKAVTKILRHGKGGPNTEYDNLDDLQREIGDVRWITDLMIMRNDVSNDIIEEWAQRKAITSRPHLHFQ